MQPASFIFQGAQAACERLIPYAQHCANIVDANKVTFGIKTSIKEFDVPGGGHVRVESLDHNTRVTITAKTGETFDEKKLKEEIEKFDSFSSRMVWLPEGFVITPRSPSAAPDGWGLDTDGSIKPGKPIRDVVINRYADNLYPDVQYVTSNADAVAPYRSEPVFFTNEGVSFFEYTTKETGGGWTVSNGNIVKVPIKPAGSIRSFNLKAIGVYLKAVIPTTLKELVEAFKRQTTKWNRTQLEPGFSVQSAEWFCHRPEVVPYIDSGEETTASTAFVSTTMKTIFNETNAYRAEVSRPPLLPPLRGYYNAVANAIIYEMQRAKVMAHETVLYRLGYRSFLDRLLHRAGVEDQVASAENIGITNLPRLPDETEVNYQRRFGIARTLSWRNSPPHYYGMTYEYKDPAYPALTEGFLELSLGGGTVTAAQTPPLYTGEPTPIYPTFGGLYATQIFRGRSRWVDAASAYWTGAMGTVSWNGLPNPCASEAVLDQRTKGMDIYDWSQNVVYHKGRTVRIFEHPSTPTAHRRVMGAGLFSVQYVLTEEEVAFRTKLTPDDQAIFDTLFSDPVYVSAVVLYAPFSAAESPSLQMYVKPLQGGDGWIVAEHALTTTAFENGRAIFSHNGLKAVVTVSDVVRHPNQYVLHNQVNFNVNSTLAEGAVGFGSSLAFVEFEIEDAVTATASVAHTSLVDVSVNQCNTVDEGADKRNTLNRSVSASYRCFAAYDVDDLVFATNHVEIVANQTCVYAPYGSDTIPINSSDPSSTGTVVQTHTATLYFPDSTNVVHTNCAGSANTMTGFVMQFEHLDILRPSEAVTSKLNLSMRAAPTAEGTTQKIDASVTIRGDGVVSFDDIGERFNDQYTATCFRGGYATSMSPTRTFVQKEDGYPHWRTFGPVGVVASGFAQSESTVVGMQNYADVCKVTHAALLSEVGFSNAVLSSQTALTRLISIAPRTGGDTSVGFQSAIVASALHYNSEHITAASLIRNDGAITSVKRFNLFGPESRGYPRAVDTPLKEHYVVSSLDLKAITGVGDLDDNIFPDGVI
jgi:hypothetical protein